MFIRCKIDFDSFISTYKEYIYNEILDYGSGDVPVSAVIPFY